MYAFMLLEEAGPNTELGWILAIVLGFFLLMVIVGWWVSNRKVDLVVEVQPVAQIHHEQKAAADDLVRLEGIGPRVAKVLNDSGITTFEALANANAVDIQKTLSAAGLQMMDPQGWIEQARLAANGDWTSLEKLQSELKGGRRK